MKLLIILIIIIVPSNCFSQKRVYYFQGTGFNTLTVYDNNKFENVGAAGLAQSITYEGEITQKNDTLLFVQKTPTLINKVDTIEVDSYETIRVDTFLIIDSKTLMNVTNNNESYYQLIQEYKNDTIIKELKWAYIDTLVGNTYINQYPVEINANIKD